MTFSLLGRRRPASFIIPGCAEAAIVKTSGVISMRSGMLAAMVSPP